MPRILDGNRVRDEIKNELKPRIAALREKGRAPGLAVVLVGHNPASAIYVRNKIKTCQDLGIHSESLTPPDSISTAELLAMVEDLNQRDEIDGILVQLPLPPQVDAKRILLAVSPGERRGRLPSFQRRGPGGGPAGSAGLHARGHYRTAEAQRYRDRG